MNVKYTIQAFKYFFKNILFVLPLMILPALAMAFTMDVSRIDKVLDLYFASKDPNAIGFGDLFRSVSVIDFSWFGIVEVVILILCVALYTAFTEKHMRIGKRTLTGLLSKLNDNLISTAGTVFLYAVIYELWAVIISALLFAVSKIPDLTAVYVISSILVLSTELALVYILTTFILWLPCLQITGFRVFEALSYSYQLLAPVRWKVLLPTLFGMIVSEVFLALLVTLVPLKAVCVPLTVVIYFFVIGSFCTKMQIVYAERAGLERMDLKKYYK